MHEMNNFLNPFIGAAKEPLILWNEIKTNEKGHKDGIRLVLKHKKVCLLYSVALLLKTPFKIDYYVSRRFNKLHGTLKEITFLSFCPMVRN